MNPDSPATPTRSDSFRKSLESVRRRSLECMLTPEMQTKLQSLPPRGSGKSTPDLLDALRDNAESFGKTSTLGRDLQRSLRSIAVAACNSAASSQHASAAGSPAHSEAKTSPEPSSPTTPLGSARKAHPFALEGDRSPPSTGSINPHGHPLPPAATSVPPAQPQAQPQAGGSYVHYGIPRHRNASQLQSRPRSRFSLEAAAEGHTDMPKASRSLDIGYCPLPKKHSRCSLVLYHDSIKEEEQENDSPMTLNVTATATSVNAAQHAHTAGGHGGHSVANSDPSEARLPSIKCHQGGRASQSKPSAQKSDADRRARAERDVSVMASLRRMFTSCGRPSVLPSGI